LRFTGGSAAAVDDRRLALNARGVAAARSGQWTAIQFGFTLRRVWSANRMMRPFIIFLIIVVSAFVAFFAANFIVQRMLPTNMDGSSGRRYGYGLLVRVIGGLIFCATGGLLGFLYEGMR
jgi:hypothetical protein